MNAENQGAFYHLRCMLSINYVKPIAALVTLVFLMGCVAVAGIVVAVARSDEIIDEQASFAPATNKEFQRFYNSNMAARVDSIYAGVLASGGEVAPKIPIELQQQPYIVSWRYIPATQQQVLVADFFLKCPCGPLYDNLLLLSINLDTGDTLHDGVMNWSKYNINGAR
jgi:hypothetical protein